MWNKRAERTGYQWTWFLMPGQKGQKGATQQKVKKVKKVSKVSWTKRTKGSTRFLEHVANAGITTNVKLSWGSGGTL